MAETNEIPEPDFDIEENLPALSLIMAVAIQQGSTTEAHQLTVNVLRMELEKALPTIHPEMRWALERALDVVAYHEDVYCGGGSLANALSEVEKNGMDGALDRILSEEKS